MHKGGGSSYLLTSVAMLHNNCLWHNDWSQDMYTPPNQKAELSSNASIISISLLIQSNLKFFYALGHEDTHIYRFCWTYWTLGPTLLPRSHHPRQTEGCVEMVTPWKWAVLNGQLAWQRGTRLYVLKGRTDFIGIVIGLTHVDCWPAISLSSDRDGFLHVWDLHGTWLASVCNQSFPAFIIQESNGT